jgi:hypothetical protein
MNAYMHMTTTTMAETVVRVEPNSTSRVAAMDAKVMHTVEPHRSNALRPTCKKKNKDKKLLSIKQPHPINEEW